MKQVARPSISDFEAVLFDMDGTLVDSEPIWFRVLQSVVDAHGGYLPDEAHAELHGLDRSSTTARLQNHYGLQGDPVIFWKRIVEELAEALAQVSAMPGAQAWVERCVASRQPCAVVSNSPHAMIEASLASQAWGHHLEVRVSVEDVANGKPAPDSYLLACTRLGVDPKRSLVVEDSEAGARAALAAGATLLFVTNGSYDIARAQALTPFVVPTLEAWL